MNKTDVLIIGAGPTGLFCAHQLGIIGLTCEIVDNLDKAQYIGHRPYQDCQLSRKLVQLFQADVRKINLLDLLQ